MQACRRRFLGQASATGLAALPLLWLSSPAAARSNAALRSQLKYQDAPFQGQNCSQCLEFLPAKAAGTQAGCKVIPDDDEISPQGWCTAWNTL